MTADEQRMEEIKSTVMSALGMRPPKFEESVPPQVKVREFEDYLLESAFMRAELEECLHWLDALVAHFKDMVDKITGFEVCLPRKAQDRITQQDVIRAKKQTDPTTFELGAEMRQLRETCLRAINRFEFEAQFVISRGYTMISGS